MKLKDLINKIKSLGVYKLPPYEDDWLKREEVLKILEDAEEELKNKPKAGGWFG